MQQGIVKDAASAREFITGMLSQNLHYTDAAFVSLAYNAAEQNDLKRILKLDDECTAVKLAMEMREASKKLGMRLIKVFQPLCKSEIVDAYKEAIIEQQAMGHYALIFGMYACALNPHCSKSSFNC